MLKNIIETLTDGINVKMKKFGGVDIKKYADYFDREYADEGGWADFDDEETSETFLDALTDVIYFEIGKKQDFLDLGGFSFYIFAGQLYAYYVKKDMKIVNHKTDEERPATDDEIMEFIDYLSNCKGLDIDMDDGELKIVIKDKNKVIKEYPKYVF
jgi:hypothetical protein